MSGPCRVRPNLLNICMMRKEILNTSSNQNTYSVETHTTLVPHFCHPVPDQPGAQVPMHVEVCRCNLRPVVCQVGSLEWPASGCGSDYDFPG